MSTAQVLCLIEILDVRRETSSEVEPVRAVAFSLNADDVAGSDGWQDPMIPWCEFGDLPNMELVVPTSSYDDNDWLPTCWDSMECPGCDGQVREQK